MKLATRTLSADCILAEASGNMSIEDVAPLELLSARLGACCLVFDGRSHEPKMNNYFKF